METARPTLTPPQITEPAHSEQSNVYIGRQPIFDRQMNIVAYEMLYRDSAENTATITCQNESTSAVILNLITEFGFETATGNKTAFINLTSDYLNGSKTVHLPANKVVLEILEDTVVDKPLIEGLNKLKAQGFSLALDDFVYSTEWDPVLPLVDYIKVEIPVLSRTEIKEHVSRLKALKVKLLAEKIESEEEYLFLLDCGFDLFQGYFLEKPRVIEGRTISANNLTILSLLSDLNNDEIEVEDLVKSISSDVSLCYKILRYINSAHFGLARTVDSIHDAITFVGLKKLKNWATLITMSRACARPGDIMQLTLTRAYMCEHLAKQLKVSDSRQCFFVGLLSTLDILLGAPMEQVLESLPLSTDNKNAIMHFTGHTGEILDCVSAYEKCDWNRISAIGLNVTPAQLRDCFISALNDTNTNIGITADN